MNLQLNDEQKMLRDSATRWVAAQSAGASHGAPSESGARRERWAAMAGFGWLAMTLPAEHDGLDQGLGEACVLAEALGAGPLADPYLGAIVQAAELISATGSAEQRRRWLPAIGSGALVVVPADIERGAPGGWAHLQTRARRDGTGWRLDGRKSVVPAGDQADAWLVSARDDAGACLCFLVPRATPGVQVQAFESVDGAGAGALSFEAVTLDADALLAGADAAALQRAFDRAAIAACAESVGAMQAMLAATVEYTRTRQQFGKPLAANQVLRHRMADMSVACDEARSMTIGAIQQFEQADAQGDAMARTLAASAVRAKVAAAARRVAEEAIQLHGGMGVTEELNMGRYLRRLIALEATYGGAETHLRRHATLRTSQRAGAGIALDNGQPEMAALSGFRDEVRAFLAEHLTPDLVRAARLNTSVFSEPDIALRWQRALYQRGWVAPAWPVEYGGTGWSLAQRWIFETECAVAGAPAMSPLGLRMAGPVIMRFGTPEQKAHYLPRILAGDDYWCQGYSEPGSGSDLASLKTRARREQDVYVINGSKIWTTHAHMANRMFALVRTGEDGARKQDGISFLLIDMATPGITVRPIRSASGDHEV
ncbi:MAG TPA: acyl-CoA dehydrogenase family protein, partial [Burkholderiaceae bacterium]|nr:acyl-CoA dehydrogenase family protein [Burkholderiaceae bacterium]